MAEFLTAALPGTGGEMKQSVEDFCVEEIPLYLPCGQGEHLYLTVEKRGISTPELLSRLARALGVREREIGYAGLKDARATTRQTLSLQGVDREQVLQLQIPDVEILGAEWHGNKLRLGHLAGNRFRIRLRKVGSEALERALDILHVLQDLGVPNRFGEQRYGVLGNNQRIGLRLLRGDFAGAAEEIIGDPQLIANARWQEAAGCYRSGDLAGARAALPPRFREEHRLLEMLLGGRSHRDAVLGLPRARLRLYLSACQSQLFDRLLAMRLATLEQFWPGDLAWKHDNGACFLVEDPAAEQPRADRFEISPTAPLFGYKVRLAHGQAGILEQSLLDKEQLTLESFRLGGGLNMEGERRPLRVPLADLSAEQQGDDLLLGFSLPRGSYATSVLHEVMKTSAAKPETA